MTRQANGPFVLLAALVATLGFLSAGAALAEQPAVGSPARSVASPQTAPSPAPNPTNGLDGSFDVAPDAVDIVATCGYPVLAVGSGKVIQLAAAQGVSVVQVLDGDRVTYYANLRHVRLAVGDRVRSGQVIGRAARIAQDGCRVRYGSYLDAAAATALADRTASRHHRVLRQLAQVAAQALQPVDVTVMDWNIHSTTLGGPTAVADDIRAAAPDVVVLEEVSSSPRTGDNARELADLLGMYYAWMPNVNLGHGHQLGNAVLSRYPISDVTDTPLPRQRGTQPRGLLHTLIDVNGVRLTVWATHLHFHGSVRLPQAATVAAQVGTPSCATILAGDLNSGPNTPMYHDVTRTMVDSFAALPGPLKWTVPVDKPDGRIDYILNSPDITASDLQVLPAGHSDHRGLKATFHVDPSVSCP